jgi:hypothetical protein
MTCAHFENDLALYAERDLPSARLPMVEAHLGECAACRHFLDDLRASQLLVRGLVAFSIDEELADLRGRVIAAAVSPGPSRDHGASPVVWAAAAVVLVAASALVWMARRAGQELREPRVVQASIATTAPSRPQRPTRHESANQVVAAVSPVMNRTRGSRPRVDRAPRVPMLSPDDADQLARAVVAVAQISSAHGRAPDPDPDPTPDAAPTPLMRVATTDPNVAIYWQLDPSGGK